VNWIAVLSDGSLFVEEDGLKSSWQLLMAECEASSLYVVKLGFDYGSGNGRYFLPSYKDGYWQAKAQQTVQGSSRIMSASGIGYVDGDTVIITWSMELDGDILTWYEERSSDNQAQIIWKS